MIKHISIVCCAYNCERIREVYSYNIYAYYAYIYIYIYRINVPEAIIGFAKVTVTRTGGELREYGESHISSLFLVKFLPFNNLNSAF